jgi:hypothetical protein
VSKHSKPLKLSSVLQSKDKYKVQLKKVFDSFYKQPKTMKEVDIETNVMRENICWYCRTLRKSNKLYAVGKRMCKVTKHLDIQCTKNPELIPTSNQIKLSL